MQRFSQPSVSRKRRKTNCFSRCQKTIQRAFRDVSNALVGYRKDREFRIEQEQLVQSAEDSARLSDYLEVLTNETNAFSAELNLAQAQGNEQVALVTLYQSLGGGWQQ